MTRPDAPVILIPARPQTLWGRPAVANFACVGLGAGFYVVAALAAEFLPSASLRLASWLGPALVLAGFVAVATETGRPLRGPRVLTRVASSWMSREMWLGGAFVVLAAGEFLFPDSEQRLLAAAAAVALVLAQGFILRRAQGVAAWSVSIMPLVFLGSAVLSGAGLWLVAGMAMKTTPGPVALGAILALLVAGQALWLRYVRWSDDPAFVDATRPLRTGPGATEVSIAGHALPLVLVGLGLVQPDLAWLSAGLGGALMIVGQVRAKALLLLEAGQLRPIRIAHLRLERRPS